MENCKIVKTAKVLDTVMKILGIFCVIGMVAMAIITALLCGSLAYGCLQGWTPDTVMVGKSVLELGFLKLHLNGYELGMGEAWMMAVSMLADLVLTVGTWYCLKVVRKILVPMKAGRPFVETVAKELRRLGWVVLILSVASAVEDVAFGAMMWHTYPISQMFNPQLVTGVEPSFILDTSFLLPVGIIFLLSYIFRYGQQLQQESDETL